MRIIKIIRKAVICMVKTKIGIIGTGNIGTDLLMKVLHSDVLECGIFAGRNLDSRGMIHARELGVPVTDESIQYIIDNPECCDIVFDATSAEVHRLNAPILKSLNKFAIDLTPAHVGKFCIPVLNGDVAIDEKNVNLITCGGQATVPIAHTIIDAKQDVKYFEIVATIASKSAGIGTRNNIDEFTQTTKEALISFTGVEHAKAIIVLNPAEPPITMHNTLYATIDKPDMDLISDKVNQMVNKIRTYIPGYRLLTGPVYENGRVCITISVMGSGDYLPRYAGNLDIITCAAIAIAEKKARRCVFE